MRLERQNYRENIQRFRAERAKLVGVVGRRFVIHHVGSTVIPKMSGKNILDILIGAPSNTELRRVAHKLAEKGYFLGKSQEDDYVFLASRTDETESGDVHIHLAIVGSERYRDFLLLKEYLLHNPKVAREYREVKRRIAKETDGNRAEYKKEKSKYVADLLKKARCYYEATGDFDSR